MLSMSRVVYTFKRLHILIFDINLFMQISFSGPPLQSSEFSAIFNFFTFRIFNYRHQILLSTRCSVNLGKGARRMRSAIEKVQTLGPILSTFMVVYKNKNKLSGSKVRTVKN